MHYDNTQNIFNQHNFSVPFWQIFQKASLEFKCTVSYILYWSNFLKVNSCKTKHLTSYRKFMAYPKSSNDFLLKDKIACWCKLNWIRRVVVTVTLKNSVHYRYKVDTIRNPWLWLSWSSNKPCQQLFLLD